MHRLITGVFALLCSTTMLAQGISESHLINLGDQVVTSGNKLNIKQLLRDEGVRLNRKKLSRVILIAKSRNGTAKVSMTNGVTETSDRTIAGIPGDYNSPDPDTYAREFFELRGYDAASRWIVKVKRGRVKFKALVAELKPDRGPRLASLDFGGMYGMYWNGSRSVPLPNPITGSRSCPAGYTATQALGTDGLDYPVFYCHRPKIPGRESIADFGGMFGGGINGPYPNAATGYNSCPADYQRTRILGTHGLDYDLFFCWRWHTPGRAPHYPFAGLMGAYWTGTHNAIYPNPITGTAACPIGYNLKRALGTDRLDYNVDYCVPQR